MNHPTPTVRDVNAAWLAIKEWYAALQTSAKKIDLNTPGSSVNNLYLWCRRWHINTAGMDAICIKHNINVQEMKAYAEKYLNVKRFGCDVPVMSVLHSRTDSKAGSCLRNIDLHKPMGLESGMYKVLYDYPLNGKVVKDHALTETTTLMQLLQLCAVDYRDIYASPQEIWGCSMESLWFEGVDVDQALKTIELSMGS